MSSRIHVALVFGGRSAEHEVSIRSARNIAEALDKSRFILELLGVSKQGDWFYFSQAKDLYEFDTICSTQPPASGKPVLFGSRQARPIMTTADDTISVDVAFPILHGTYGEDGCVQGLFKMLNLPYVGCDVMSSATGMDKDIMKRLFLQAGIPTADYVLVTRTDTPDFPLYREKLGLPMFIKPANAGSSIGVHKVKTEAEFGPALEDALRYDRKVIIERYIQGREIECSVLGTTDAPKASTAGEVITTHDFYSYEAKYLDENGARTEIPAKIDAATLARIQALAEKTFTAMGCFGMARVDFFLTESGALYVNEINTLPGFTNISMYPKMWEHSGVTYTDLITRLIDLAMQRQQEEATIVTNFN
ncbi:D-alanine-D-alanine ligase [gamma proteobacterium HdN1]|nr:D-alanine-D-alanine ligase [gamma proteobacterium HdN1]